MKAYYARPITHYNTKIDNIALKTLSNMGLELINPNQEKYQIEYKERGMDVFLELIKDSDVLFFKSFWEGLLTAGVKKEIDYAKSLKIPVFEFTQVIRHRVLTVEETRKAIKMGVK